MISVLTGAKFRAWEQSHMIGRFTSLAKTPKNTFCATWICKFGADFGNWNASPTYHFFNVRFSLLIICAETDFLVSTPPLPPRAPQTIKRSIRQSREVFQNLSRNPTITLCLHSTVLISSKVNTFQHKNRSKCITDVLTTYPGIWSMNCSISYTGR